MKNIKINSIKCLGCGSCAVICPDAFEIGDDGKAEVKKSWKKAVEKQIKQAVEACPVEAIVIK